MNNTTSALLSILLATAVGAGCSQSSRDEAIDRATQAAKALNGKADNTPDVVKEQIKKEKERQNSQWTIENVSAHPIEACNAKLEELDGKIEKAKVAYNRALSAQASAWTAKGAAEAEVAKYTAFLEAARPAYKAAKEDGKWPITVNGYSLGEEAAEEKILVALKKVGEFKAKVEKASAQIDAMGRRMKEVKQTTDELNDRRDKVLEYRENIRSGQLQSEIKGLVGVLNEGGVKMSDIEAVNATQGIDVSDDVFQPSQNSADKALLDDFLK